MLRRTLLVAALATAVHILPAAPALASSCTIRLDLGPGESRSQRCTVPGGPSDATHFWGLTAVKVFDAQNQEVTDGRKWEFADFYRWSLSTERFVTTKNGVDPLLDRDVARVPYPLYKPVCTDRATSSFSTDLDDMCRIGRVRRSGTAFDTRSFEITVRMLDLGDQSRFIGWYMGFSQHYVACVGTSCPGTTGSLFDEL
ncbi:MAG TPA: hypothetical protein VM840_06200 [Actinomycetota bacterium]|nr:hypothetical protein [Actinomycetota bacterium]